MPNTAERIVREIVKLRGTKHAYTEAEVQHLVEVFKSSADMASIEETIVRVGAAVRNIERRASV